MSYLAAVQAIQGYFEAQWIAAGRTEPRKWPNFNFTAPDGPWIGVTVVDNISEQIDLLVSAATFRHDGMVIIQFLDKSGSATEKHYAMIDAACAILRGRVISSTYFFGAPQPQGPGFETEDGYYQMNVNFPFDRDEQFDISS